jgi:hypothetical protein
VCHPGKNGALSLFFHFFADKTQTPFLFQVKGAFRPTDLPKEKMMNTRTAKNPVMRTLLTALVVAGSLLAGPGISTANAGDVVSDTMNKMQACGFTEPAAAYSSCLSLQHPSRHEGNYDRWNNRGEICTEIMNAVGAPVSYIQDHANQADAHIASTNCDKSLIEVRLHALSDNFDPSALCNDGETLLQTDSISGDPCTEQHGPEGRESCNDPEYCGDPENCGACAYDEESDHCFIGDADQNASNEQVVAYCLVDAVACAEPLAAADASESARNDAVAEKQSCETDKASIEAAKVTAVAEKLAAVTERDAAIAERAQCATELSTSQTATTNAIATKLSCETDKASIEAAWVAAVTERNAAVAEQAQCVIEREAALAERARCATELDPAHAAAGPLDMTTHYLKIDGSIGTAMPLTSCIEGQEFQSAQPTPIKDRVCQALTVCDGVNTYESTAQTETADRICTVQPICGDHQTIVRDGTPERARECANICGEDEYFHVISRSAPSSVASSGSAATVEGECRPVTVCGGATPNQAHAPTATSDRVCAAPVTLYFQTNGSPFRTCVRSISDAAVAALRDDRSRTLLTLTYPRGLEQFKTAPVTDIWDFINDHGGRVDFEHVRDGRLSSEQGLLKNRISYEFGHQGEGALLLCENMR